MQARQCTFRTELPKYGSTFSSPNVFARQPHWRSSTFTALTITRIRICFPMLNQSANQSANATIPKQMLHLAVYKASTVEIVSLQVVQSGMTLLSICVFLPTCVIIFRRQSPDAHRRCSHFPGLAMILSERRSRLIFNASMSIMRFCSTSSVCASTIAKVVQSCFKTRYKL